MASKLFVPLLLFFGALASAVGSEGHKSSPRYLVHLLDYIATDYAGAVAKGKVLSAVEYQEQREFVDLAIETERQLEQTRSAPEVSARLQELRGLIFGKADPGAVKRAARRIEGRVIQLSGIDVSPSKWPDRLRGKGLYQRDCAACHGRTGLGDGVAGKHLSPPPANLRGDKMAGSAPFQLFNAIRLGVPGTAMPAFEQLSDQEIWDLAFYIASMRSDPELSGGAPDPTGTLPDISLKQAATTSDEELMKRLPGTPSERRAAISRARLLVPGHLETSSLDLAKKKLSLAKDLSSARRWDKAKGEAILAYLEGVEPAEPTLRAKDLGFTAILEEKMAAVRSSIEAREPDPVIGAKVSDAMGALDRASALLEDKESSPWLTFTVAAGIFLREGFEAVLILIMLLGVIRSIGAPRAALFVHAGWILALAVGALCWLFSGWVMAVSGAGREYLEGVVSLMAVVILLYFGFWLHRKTEIGKWKAFLSEMVKSALEGKKLLGLSGVAFMAVFRESLEVVLFLRALSLQSNGQYQGAMLAGVLVSLGIVIGLAWALIRFSARLPLRQLFGVSSLTMILLALILVGKALHSFQEVGLISITRMPLGLYSDLVGIYPTYETFVPQLIIIASSLLVWRLARRNSARRPLPPITS